MQRPIVGFASDADGDWVAILNCGHPQHVRHQPPFTNRPWVMTADGRNSQVGAMLNCVRCDKFEFPEDFVAYKKTPIFDQASVPKGLQKNHTTKAGVWAKIMVIDGSLRYIVDKPARDLTLSKGQPGIVMPEVPHRIEPIGVVHFYVEFYRSQQPTC